MGEHTAAGQKFRRKVAREFRQRINYLRLGAKLYREKAASKHFHERNVMSEVAMSAGISTTELRAIVFGTRDPDIMTIGAIAHALGLTPKVEILRPMERIP